MSFEKYLKAKKIDKVVDPGGGQSPSASLLKESPTSIFDYDGVKDTPLDVTIDDLLLESQAVGSLVTTIIDEIVEENKSSQVFVEYHQKVKDNYFDPSILINNPDARPKIVHEPNDIKSLERQVYRSQLDPRASFIQDLYSQKTLAGLSEYTLQNYWKKMVRSNDFYTNFEVSDSVYLALGKQSQQLQQLREAAQRVQRNKVQSLSYQFLEAFSNRLTDQIYIEIPSAQITKINKLIETLKQVRAILNVAVILSNQDWEKFSINLRDIFGDTLQLIATHVSKLSAYPLLFGTNQSVNELIEGISDFLPLDLTVADVPEARDFVNRINSCYMDLFAIVEDDLIYRESIQIKTEENRQLLLANSQKKSKLQQYLEVMNSSINVLEEIKNTLYGLNTNITLDSKVIAQKLISSLDHSLRGKTTTIVVGPAKPVPDDVNKYNA